ncbi:uncharacterized protein LTHEOB_11363 [Lasiodiplodia theobromae]|uniref:uncharacterized protein n=1 Tax=Lasiodiplodia theobromae TaxID=45133 RepID=UPI0015C38C65|nr:uncharacterized protein LTHEOB_11363 [Lasiodiplodia theobromae]KAF4537879.1 hypothetical protein LTHEOB_11363 [Lasiodiplodia theobromae]
MSTSPVGHSPVSGTHTGHPMMSTASGLMPVSSTPTKRLILTSLLAVSRKPNNRPMRASQDEMPSAATKRPTPTSLDQVPGTPTDRPMPTSPGEVPSGPTDRPMPTILEEVPGTPDNSPTSTGSADVNEGSSSPTPTTNAPTATYSTLAWPAVLVLLSSLLLCWVLSPHNSAAPAAPELDSTYHPEELLAVIGPQERCELSGIPCEGPRCNCLKKAMEDAERLSKLLIPDVAPHDRSYPSQREVDFYCSYIKGKLEREEAKCLDGKSEPEDDDT